MKGGRLTKAEREVRGLPAAGAVAWDDHQEKASAIVQFFLDGARKGGATYILLSDLEQAVRRDGVTVDLMEVALPERRGNQKPWQAGPRRTRVWTWPGARNSYARTYLSGHHGFGGGTVVMRHDLADDVRASRKREIGRKALTPL